MPDTDVLPARLWSSPPPLSGLSGWSAAREYDIRSLPGRRDMTDQPSTRRSRNAVEPGVPRDPESSLALVERARDGDDEALGRLCARYLPRLQRWAHGRLPSWARGAL